MGHLEFLHLSGYLTTTSNCLNLEHLDLTTTPDCANLEHPELNTYSSLCPTDFDFQLSSQLLSTRT